jgi:hypothetical protein
MFHFVICMSGCRQGLEWWLDLLTTYTLMTHDYTLQTTDTQIIVLSLLQSPLAISWQRIIEQEL